MNLCAPDSVARRRVDACIDRDDGSSERLHLGGKDLHDLSRPQLARDLLRDREINIRRFIHTLKRCEVTAFVEVLAGMHVGDTDARTEWCANGLTLDHSFDACDLR